MKYVSMEEAHWTLEQIALKARSETLIVTENGEPLLSIHHLSKDDRERMALARNPKFIAIIEASRRSLRENGGLTMEEVCKKHGLSNPADSDEPVVGSRRKTTKGLTKPDLSEKKTKRKGPTVVGVRSRSRRPAAVTTK